MLLDVLKCFKDILSHCQQDNHSIIKNTMSLAVAQGLIKNYSAAVFRFQHYPVVLKNSTYFTL